jgi:hypothetical protein
VPRMAHPTNRPLSGKTQCSAAIIHQTVRFAQGQLSTSPQRGQRLTSTATANGQKWSEKAGHTGLSGVPPECPVHHKGRQIQ